MGYLSDCINFIVRKLYIDSFMTLFYLSYLFHLSQGKINNEINNDISTRVPSGSNDASTIATVVDCDRYLQKVIDGNQKLLREQQKFSQTTLSEQQKINKLLVESILKMNNELAAICGGGKLKREMKKRQRKMKKLERWNLCLVLLLKIKRKSSSQCSG